MNNTLKSLWHSHIKLCNYEPYEDEQALMNKLTAADNKLREELTAGQAALLQSVEDCLNDIEYIECERAFIEGVRFAVKFLCEASK